MTTASVAQIRDEARTWFEANWEPDLSLGQWWERLAGSGFAFPTWPLVWHGKGLTSALAAIVAEERSSVGAYGPPNGIRVTMAGPTVVNPSCPKAGRDSKSGHCS